MYLRFDNIKLTLTNTEAAEYEIKMSIMFVCAHPQYVAKLTM